MMGRLAAIAHVGLCALARNGRSRMSAIRSLSGIKQTYAEGPRIDANDPLRTSAIETCCSAK
jgi:hypothetical protein